MIAGTTASLSITRQCRTLGRKCFPTLFTSRGARHRSASSDRHVPKLTCRARDSLINLTITDDPGSQSLFNQDQDKVTHVANLRPAEPQLSECRSIRVVISRYRQSCTLVQVRRERPVAPFEVWNKKRGACFRIDESWHTHADTFDV